MTPEQTAALTSFLTELELGYSAEFVPQSKSRNAQDKRPTLNWRVTIKRGRAELTTDYMQGIGHVPNYQHHASTLSTRDYQSAQHRAAELGTYPPRMMDRSVLGYDNGRKKLDPPKLTDVLHSLILDANVLDFARFEDWASEYGYDADSRKAEATYRACLELALQLRAVLGDEAITKLRDLFQDY